MTSVLRGNEIYWESDLIARYSSWMEYLNDFFSESDGLMGCVFVPYRLN